MLSVTRRAHECFAAVLAVVLEPLVLSHVICVVRLLVEAPSTLPTVIFALSSVQLHVSFELRLCRVALLTLGAGEAVSKLRALGADPSTPGSSFLRQQRKVTAFQTCRAWW